MTNVKTILRGTTIAAALAVALPMLNSDPAQARPNSCFSDGYCTHCWTSLGEGSTCVWTSCGGVYDMTCWAD